jgi:ABC-type nitrate/sulfonate/bicarbonate transport system permease component
MIAIGLIGLIIDRIIRIAARHLMPWSRSLNN